MERPELENVVAQNAERWKQPIFVSNFQDFGVTKGVDQVLQHFRNFQN